LGSIYQLPRAAVKRISDAQVAAAPYVIRLLAAGCIPLPSRPFTIFSGNSENGGIRKRSWAAYPKVQGFQALTLS